MGVEFGESAGLIIRTYNLTKEYDGRVAVHKANLLVRPGEIYGFLGPNGAGKTTTIRMILGLLRPTSGRVELFGHDIQQASPRLRQRLGVVGEHSFLYDDMTAFEYLTFFAGLHRVPDASTRAMELLERLDLAPFAHLLARDFSQGMQKKLGVARALLHDPELLILDEPVSGLDPYGIVQVRELLEEKRQAGHAVLVSSHILSEVERTANRVGIIHRGHLIMEDTVDTVIGKLIPGMQVEIELRGAIANVKDALAQLPGVQQVREENGLLVVDVEGDTDVRPMVAEAVAAAGGTLLGLKRRKATLEEAFVRLTEGKLQQAGILDSQDDEGMRS